MIIAHKISISLLFCGHIDKVVRIVNDRVAIPESVSIVLNISILFKFQCLDVEFEYGFEYLGSSAREVITPLTERTFVSLIQSINSYLGSMCVGPIVSTFYCIFH